MDDDGGLARTVTRIGSKLNAVKQSRATRWSGSDSTPEELAQLQRCTAELECLTDAAALKACKHRSFVLQELLTTERTYCGALSLIRTHFAKPLKFRENLLFGGKGEPIIADEDWDQIFGGFDEVYKFQHRLLQELEAVRSQAILQLLVMYGCILRGCLS